MAAANDKWVSSFLMVHQHILGIVPNDGVEDVIE